MSLRVHIVYCSPAASRRGFGPVKSGPKDCLPWRVGQQHIWVHSACPGLSGLRGRCSSSTRRAVCPSKRLKTWQRYQWRAGRFCAIGHTRTAPGQPSRTARAAARRRAPGAGQRGGLDIPFRTTEIRSRKGGSLCKNHRTLAPVLDDSPSSSHSF